MRRILVALMSLGSAVSLVLLCAAPSGHGSNSAGSFVPEIPKTWDDQAMATLEVPLANPVGSPRQASADYYYRIPEGTIYKTYPVYAPGREPAGYMDWLKQQEPQIVWDGGHRPSLQTEGDWIAAGEIVFDAPTRFSGGALQPQYLSDLEWYRATGTPVAKDGTVPFAVWVIREKGKPEMGSVSCATCHVRVMPDGSIVKGAQGSLGRAVAYFLRATSAHAKDLGPATAAMHLNFKAMWSVPWLGPDPELPIDGMSFEMLAAAEERIPPGVFARQRTSLFYPVQIPDLIGVKDRRYLDRTGLQQHRSIGDLMRYAAMNRGVFDGGDALASHDGFIPADRPNFKALPEPTTQSRYSDEQLYALALYLYSLKPPPNPNRFDAVAARGQRVFEHEGCAGCHTPPLYTNNKLTLANGFTPPPGAEQKYDILPISVGTDAGLALKTRRGTGYYKVPSLKGVWYRGMFGHSGWCATLEDWFDARRTADDYVPTGFMPFGAKTYAVKGHPFGLNLSAEDKKALIAFLKTL